MRLHIFITSSISSYFHSKNVEEHRDVVVTEKKHVRQLWKNTSSGGLQILQEFSSQLLLGAWMVA